MLPQSMNKRCLSFLRIQDCGTRLQEGSTLYPSQEQERRKVHCLFALEESVDLCILHC